LNFRFPVFLDVTGKNCVVTGEGFEVPAKVLALVNASADVTYIHPHADDRIRNLAEAGLIHWERRAFTPSDLEDCFLLIADTENNAEIFQLAEERRVLCNSVDDPANCRFSFGSVHRRGELMIAISTNGWAPAVAVRLREWLEREIGPEYADLLAILKDARPLIAQSVPEFAARKQLWYELVDSELLELLRSGHADEAKQFVAARIQRAADSH
jgi:siroheme synthase-like protein